MTLKETLLQRPVCGLLVKVSDSLSVPAIASSAGMDFLFYDLEHGVISEPRILDLAVAGNAMGIPSVARVPQLARKDVSRTLDSGVQGIMVPMMETREQAEQLASWALYPPKGNRSYSGGANTMYGPSGNHRSNMDAMNNAALVLAQIETLKGVENLDAILDVEGIDGAVVGPCDLGISMNNPDNMYDENEVALIQTIQNKARAHGKFFGLIGPYKLMEQLDYPTDICTAAFDTSLLRAGMEKGVQDFNDLQKHWSKGEDLHD